MVDNELWRVLKESSLSELRGNPETLRNVITRAVLAKVKIVEADEREKHLRVCLNFGHTIGHAVEAERSGLVSHGLCVAYGMLKELEICQFFGIHTADLAELREVLQVICI